VQIFEHSAERRDEISANDEQVLIEYKGFRIVAQSILPINESTILYGSADGGK
jgi:hypothetical protein